MATHRRLDRDTERALAIRYRTSVDTGHEDVDARNELIEAHIPLIRSVASKVHSANLQHTQLEELVAVGCMGMIEGLRSFEPEMGTRVGTYCVYWIRNAIHAHVREFRWQTLSENDYKQILEYHRAISRMPVRFDGYVDFTELARTLKITEDRCRRLYSLTQSLLSLETPISRNGKLKLADTLKYGSNGRSDKFTAVLEEARRLVHLALAKLSAEERRTIESHFFEKEVAGYIEYMQVVKKLFADMGRAEQFKAFAKPTAQETQERKRILTKLSLLPSLKRAYNLLMTHQEK
jgi:RNA polymerase sigma factor (sigma-70 family)